MQKCAMLRERVHQARLSGDEPLYEPAAASDAQILRAHDAAYLRRVARGELAPADMRRIGFPWTL